MSTGLEGVGVALELFSILKAIATYLCRAARDFHDAQNLCLALLDDIEQCIRYATSIRAALERLSSQMDDRERRSTKKLLTETLGKAKDLDSWAKANLIAPSDRKRDKAAKKLKVAVGKVRKLSDKLTKTFNGLRRIDAVVTIQLQTQILDVSLATKDELSLVSKKVDSMVPVLLKLEKALDANKVGEMEFPTAPPPYDPSPPKYVSAPPPEEPTPPPSYDSVELECDAKPPAYDAIPTADQVGSSGTGVVATKQSIFSAIARKPAEAHGVGASGSGDDIYEILFPKDMMLDKDADSLARSVTGNMGLRFGIGVAFTCIVSSWVLFRTQQGRLEAC